MTDGFPLLVLEGKDDGAKEKAAVGLTLGVAASIPVTPLSEPPAVAALLELLSTSSLSRSNKIDNTAMITRSINISRDVMIGLRLRLLLLPVLFLMGSVATSSSGVASPATSIGTSSNVGPPPPPSSDFTSIGTSSRSKVADEFESFGASLWCASPPASVPSSFSLFSCPNSRSFSVVPSSSRLSFPTWISFVSISATFGGSTLSLPTEIAVFSARYKDTSGATYLAPSSSLDLP